MDLNPVASSGILKIENTEKRDTLQATEREFQKLWQYERIFESDAPSCSDIPLNSVAAGELRLKFPKYFCTMAYPYVNGVPHLGHGFTASKVEFASRVARAQGKRTLYPQGYHATGMPILACADKLINEQRLFGQNFERYSEAEAVGEELVSAIDHVQVKEDVTKFVNTKKGKAALKTVKAKYQFQVMLSLGVPREEIHKFANAHYWLEYFPQLWQKHLVQFGCGIDWRRSFITTDANPYYDSFVQWQMRRLKELGKIQFGKRYTVYSPKDGQPCLDHDRSVGEAIEPAQQALAGKLPSPANIFMVPATLRPETMYGQGNLFVSPAISYGLFQVSTDEFLLVTDRAARNMAFQGLFPKWGTYTKFMELKGSQIIGTLVHAPLSRCGNVYVVPMDTIKEAKGTGVVTSVPSDSPDDYAMTVDLSKKPEFYGITSEMVPSDILPIIEVPGYGDRIAPFLVKKMKINSPKDVKQLSEAKEIAYKQGLYEGIMIFGEFTGKPVQEAKNLVRQKLLDSGDAFLYCEPEGLVISRSEDECVAAFLDQWYLTYGAADKAWRDEVLRHTRSDDGQNFNAFTTATKNAIEQSLAWISQWAVTRQYGLGTKLPWDKSQVVESLSDSTIYMAYYTVAHFLHSDIFGTRPGIGNIRVTQMNDAVWDYIFALRDEVQTEISDDILKAMRREFTYWYPLDVRCSGKDLVNNHILFFLHVHQAIWGRTPEYLPKGIRLNGHVTMNGEKMSKSTGNFLTLDAAIQKFGADATRVALADAGDGFEDANFEETVANASILKLYELRKWTEEVIMEARVLKDGELYATIREVEEKRTEIMRTGVKTFWDKLFDNELNILVKETVHHYEAGSYKSALQTGFYEFTAARDTYRVSTSSALIGMHHECVQRYVELQALMICVIAPHWAEHVWRKVLEKPTSIATVTFPAVSDPDPVLTAASKYILSTTSAISAAESSQIKRLAKGKAVSYDPKQPKRLAIDVTQTWPTWQAKYVELAREMFDGVSLDVKDLGSRIEKVEMKKAMPFVQSLKKRLESGESEDAVFERKLGFDEAKVLQEMAPGLVATVPRLRQVDIIIVDEQATSGWILLKEGKKWIESLTPVAKAAEPGSPTFEFTNM